MLLLVGLLGGWYLISGKKNNQTVSQTTPTPTPDPTADWKVYKNTKIGFQIKYPSKTKAPIFDPGGGPLDGPNAVPQIYQEVDGTENDVIIEFPGNNPNYAIEYFLEIFPFTGTLEQAVVGSQTPKNRPYYPVFPNEAARVEKTFKVGGIDTLWYQDGDSESTFYVVIMVAKNHAFIFRSALYVNESSMEQILSTFKFTDQSDTVKSEWEVLKTFTTSKGTTKYIVLVNVPDETIPDFSQQYVYLSNTETKNSQAIKLTGVTAADLRDSPFIANNSGVKYFILEPIAGDGINISLWDENGKEIKIDYSKMGLGTIIQPQYGAGFKEWVGNTTNFIIKAIDPYGKVYEATFSATTGKQIGETKKVSD